MASNSLNSHDTKSKVVEASPPAPERPPLLSDPSFTAITATQFLGAFNDNLFKQVILLLFVAVPVVAANGEASSIDLQWLGTLAFSLPFIFFSGYAGYLSDRHSKRRVICLSKVAEIVIMSLGMCLFVAYAYSGMTTLLVTLLSLTLFLMGTQSAFFGPGKYGILPELFRNRDLPAANGLILMTTFLAIIFGSALAGFLLGFSPGKLIGQDVDSPGTRLWIAGIACVFIAMIGTLTSLGIRPLHPAQPKLKLALPNMTIPSDIWRLLKSDHGLRQAVVVSTVFWLAAALVQMAVNALGKLQLGVNELWTSLLVSVISVGIAVGSLIGGAASRHRFNSGLIRTGAWGLIVCLSLLALPGTQERPHLLGYWGCMVTLVLLGGFTGLFAVPIQVFLQSRPPRDLKGRMIATQNLLNWVGISLSAFIYSGGNLVRKQFGWPNSSIFWISAGLMLAVALFYHPRSEKL